MEQTKKQISTKARAILPVEKEKRKQQVLELYEQGLRPKEIAYEIKRSVNVVYSIMKELREEGKIEERVLFDTPEVRNAVIMYMVNRKYADHEIGKILGISYNTVYKVKNMYSNITDEKINEMIEAHANSVELANAKYIQKKVENNEAQIIEMLQHGIRYSEIAQRLNLSIGCLRKIIDSLVFQEKVSLRDTIAETKESELEKEATNMYKRRKSHIKNQQNMKARYIRKCRKELQVLSNRVKSGKVNELEKNKYFECCNGIVRNGEKLTLEEIKMLSEATVYGEGEVNIEAIRFITTEYAKVGNLKPALQLVNACITVHGKNEDLENARNVVLEMYKKQVILQCLKKGLKVEETMARTGARENEVREIERKYMHEKLENKQENREKVELGR